MIFFKEKVQYFKRNAKYFLLHASQVVLELQELLLEAAAEMKPSFHPNRSGHEDDKNIKTNRNRIGPILKENRPTIDSYLGSRFSLGYPRYHQGLLETGWCSSKWSAACYSFCYSFCHSWSYFSCIFHCHSCFSCPAPDQVGDPVGHRLQQGKSPAQQSQRLPHLSWVWQNVKPKIVI